MHWRYGLKIREQFTVSAFSLTVCQTLLHILISDSMFIEITDISKIQNIRLGNIEKLFDRKKICLAE
jgi:hypothetical protein